MRLLLALLIPAFMHAATITYTAEFSINEVHTSSLFGYPDADFAAWEFTVNMGEVLADTVVDLATAPSFQRTGSPLPDAVWDRGYVADMATINEMYAFLHFDSATIGHFYYYVKSGAVSANGTYPLGGNIIGSRLDPLVRGTLVVHTPEPGTFWLIGLLLTACGMFRYRPARSRRS
jgi:hypothetical protein